MPYRLYESNNTTVVTIPQPEDSSFNYGDLERRNNGGMRKSEFALVEWRFKKPMTEANYKLLTLWTPPGGLVQFDTWRGAQGATSSAFLKCEGIQEKVAGKLVDGEWRSVFVRFSAVRVL